VSAAAPALHSGQARDDALEGLRGCAALAVFSAHLTAPATALDPGYTPSPWFWRFEMATPAVLLFFVISGYVIGLTNPGPPSRNAVGAYLWRRAVRLFPIYLAAVALTGLLVPNGPLRDFLGHVLLLQNASPDTPFGVGLLEGNPNLWSLHYEGIYYLGFVLLWCCRLNLAVLLGAAGTVGALGLFLPAFPLWLAWLACGFVFWLAGLAVAWRLPQAGPNEPGPWPTAVLLAVAVWRLQPAHTLLSHFGFTRPWFPGVSFACLDLLPCLLWMFLIVTRRQGRWTWLIELGAWISAAGYLGWLGYAGLFGWSGDIGLAAVLVAAALLLRGWSPSLAGLQRLAPLGAVSYALYVFAAPLQHGMRTLFPQWSGAWWTYSARLMTVVAGAQALAWLAERKIQPLVRRWLNRAVGFTPPHE
jgi:peptidoglycan/LPS O-acetylase OafA/YrhL